MSRAGARVSRRLQDQERGALCSVLSTLVLTLTALLPVPASAGVIAFSDQAALTGGLGMAVLADCEGAGFYDVVTDSGIAGPATVAACNTLTSGAEIMGAVTLMGGSAVILTDGFAASTGASVEIGIDPVLASDFSWVEDDSPDAVAEYQASFHIRMDDYSLADPDFVVPFVAFSDTGQTSFSLVLVPTMLSPLPRLAGVACLEDLSCEDTIGSEEIGLASGWNLIKVHWKAGPGTGFLEFSVNDGAPSTMLNSLENGSLRVDFVRLGQVAGDPGSATGSFHLDHFASWK